MAETQLSTQTGGVPSGPSSGEELVEQFRQTLRQRGVKLQSLPPGKQAEITYNFLTGSIPGYSQASEADQLAAAQGLITRVQQPTVGEGVQRTMQETLPVVAGTVGLAAPGGGIPAGIVAAGATRIAAELARPLTTGDAPDLFQAAREAATGAAFLGLGEKVITRPLGQVLDFTLGRARRTMIAPGAQEEATVKARALLKPFLKAEGVELSPVQMSETPPALVELGENIAEYGLGGRGTVRGQRLGVQQALSKAATVVEDLLSRGQTNEEVVALFLKDFKGMEMAHRAMSARLHGVVDQLSQKGVVVPSVGLIAKAQRAGDDPVTTDLLTHFNVPESKDKAGNVLFQGYAGPKGFAEMMTKTLQPAVPSRTSPLVGPTGKPIVTPARPAIVKHELSFEEADRARSALLSVARDFKGLGASGHDKQVAKLAGQMAEELRVQMDGAAARFSPAAAAAYADAKEFHRTEVIERFENEVLLSVVGALEKQPGKLSQFLLQKDVVDKLDVIKNSTTPEAWRGIQGKLLGNMLVRSTDREMQGFGIEFKDLAAKGLINKFDGPALKQNVKTIGTEAEQLIFEGAAGETFRNIANAVEVEARRPAGPGKVGIALIQFGAVAGLLTAGGTLAAGGDWASVAKAGVVGSSMVLLTPYVFAKLIRNTQRMQNIADGIIGGPQSKAWSRLLMTTAALNTEVQRELGEGLQKAASPSALPAPGGPPPTKQVLRPEPKPRVRESTP